ncbi:hypothetical protein [Microlunatus ginsengisoli]|uniref:Flagellin N-terminal-like domain-containing protein n=1 Tax=Microlunatus ginsengisoli TaxID=363863 RepID=A0ABP7AL87_9ACTN
MNDPVDERRGDLGRRRAEVGAWFSHGPGGIAVIALAVILAVMLTLTAVGWL